MLMLLVMLVHLLALSESESLCDETNKLVSKGDTQLDLEVDGASLRFSLTNQMEDVVMEGSFGSMLPDIIGAPVECEKSDADICLSWPGLAELTIIPEDSCHKVSWRSTGLRSITDCIDIRSERWFGGPEELVQHFPLRTDNPRSRVAYLPGDMIQEPSTLFGGVVEPFWVNSRGGGLVAMGEQPLFYSWNSQGDGKLCLGVEGRAPYMVTDDPMELEYYVCGAQNPKAMFQYSAGRFWSLPSGTPDERMFTHPIWSTWAQYKTDINESVVMEFANNIVNHGFDNSQLEIDDKWETCYGDATFDLTKFPEPKNMVSHLKEMGFRVTLWVHPFINQECSSFSQFKFLQYFVRDPKYNYADGGLQNLPGMTYWWAGNWAGYVDFTNQEAAQWWSNRLELLRAEVGLDSFKFDAGESNWLPSSYILDNKYSQSSWPGVFSTDYIRTVAEFGNMVEVRTGRRSQDLPIFTRMLDKFSTWGYDNGLKSMVTTLLQFGLVGYPFVLPDMIGGNGYDYGLPSRELYIRWLQVNVFMPAMQISFVPWQYDVEVVEHALNMTKLHAQYSETIITLAKQAVEDGTPINRPIWWVDPTDQEAFFVDDEFMLGDNLLVAPVMYEGAVARDVYIPMGLWVDTWAGGETLIQGPTWLRDYKANLFQLPFFTRI